MNPTINPDKLKQKIIDHFKSQGLEFDSDGNVTTELTPRQLHGTNKRQPKQTLFSSKIDPNNIKPRLVLCETKEAKAEFKELSQRNWSTEHTQQRGRMMCYIIYDEGHNTPMGILGLSSPVISVAGRDRYLGIKGNDSQAKINLAMNLFRCGGIEPYHEFYASRLAALLSVSKEIRDDFRNKYDSELVFCVTMGAYGKTPIYDRHRVGGQKLSWFTGYSHGSGTFTIPDSLFRDMKNYLRQEGVDVDKKQGRQKLKLSGRCLGMLGLKGGTKHGIKRACYLLTACTNLMDVLHKEAEPNITDFTVDNLVEEWRNKYLARVK